VRPPISFCVITAGLVPDKLATAIASIRHQQIPDVEIAVVGRHRQEPGIIYVPLEAAAEEGRLGAMRNAGVRQTHHPHIVILDDDIFLAPDWYEQLSAGPLDFDIQTSQIRLPDGGRYWDHATVGGPDGHRMLEAHEDDDHLYMTGGGGWAIARRVAEAVSWDDTRGFYQSEDLDFSRRCTGAGFRIRHNHACVVFHDDDRYTQIGRNTHRRTEGRGHGWVRTACRAMMITELGQEIDVHMKAERIAEAADCLRVGVEQFPEEPGFERAWKMLEDHCGGRLSDTRWDSAGDSAYLDTLRLYGAGPRPQGGVASSTRDPRVVSATPGRAREVFGVNLFGFLSGNLGLGVVARSYVRLFDEAGVPCQPIEIPLHGDRSGHDLSYADRICQLHDPTPYSVNLFVVNGGDLPMLMTDAMRSVQLSGRLNACIPFWELPRLPPDWLPPLSAMDVVGAGSQFIRYAALADLENVAVPYWPNPLHLAEDVVADRARFGLPEDAVIFITSFEMASDIARKNPTGAIEAFTRAFAPDENVVLVVKVNNSSHYEEHMRALQELASHHSGIRIVDQVMSYPDVLALYASTDAFVSLHRAEGLGLCLLECMALGKPVIATGWSGNMDYMNEQNACLVRYRLVPVRGTAAAYSPEYAGRDTRWAEPDLDQAAVWMRRLAEDAELRQRIGKRAAADIAARNAAISVPDMQRVMETRAALIGKQLG